RVTLAGKGDRPPEAGCGLVGRGGPLRKEQLASQAFALGLVEALAPACRQSTQDVSSIVELTYVEVRGPEEARADWRSPRPADGDGPIAAPAKVPKAFLAIT